MSVPLFQGGCTCTWLFLTLHTSFVVLKYRATVKTPSNPGWDLSQLNTLLNAPRPVVPCFFGEAYFRDPYTSH